MLLSTLKRKKRKSRLLVLALFTTRHLGANGYNSSRYRRLHWYVKIGLLAS